MLFAFSHMHLAVVTWVAARNQLIAACFIVLTVLAYHHWRSKASAWHGWLAALFFALSLFSAEAGIAALGYLVAYSLALESHVPWRLRLRALLPFFVMVIAWRLAYNHLHYGSTDSGSYIDPGANLTRFLGAMLLRLPTLIMAQVFGVPAGLRNGAPMADQLQYAILATCTVVFFIALGQYFKLWASPRARFYALGAFFAMVPVCATEASDRLLLNGEIGTGVVLAMLFALMLEHHRRQQGWSAKGARGVVGLLMTAHLIFFPVTTLVASVVLTIAVAPMLEDEPMALPDVHGADLNRHVILLNPPRASMVFYYPQIRHYFGYANPASIQALANGIQEVTVRVVDASTLEVSSPGGFRDVLTRDTVTRPFKVGDTVDIGQVVVTVEQLDATGMAVAAKFHFKAPLKDQQWRFYTWVKDGYAPIELPDPGHVVVLPAIEVSKLISKRLKDALKI
jgi:hypothetical protein